MGREPNYGVGTEDATGQRDRRVVLADVHAVGPGLERQVGTVVQDEGHTVLVAEGDGRAGSVQERSSLEVLSRSCTTSTPPTMHAVRNVARSGRSGVQR